MTALKLLFNEYQEIESSIKRHDDLTLCQPILKEAFDNLISLQSLTSKTNWFSEINSLMNSEDPSIIQELQSIMEQFKPK